MTNAKESLLNAGFDKAKVTVALAQARKEISGQYGNWLSTVYQGRLYSCAKAILAEETDQ